MSNRILARVPWSLLAILLMVTPGNAQLVSTSDSPSPDAQTLSKLDPLLLARISNLSGSSKVVVQAVDAAALEPVALLIQQAGGSPGRSLPIIDALAAEVPNSSVLGLASSSLIRRLALDRLILGTMERTAATVGADSVRQQLGYNGSGIGVAIIDSGITSWHDDLTVPALPGSQRVDQFVDLVNGGAVAYDDYGHGTHVAGIIAGNGIDSNGARAGIAPAAHLIVFKVLDGSGRGRISNVIGAFDYAVRYRNLFHIRIINVSIAAGVFESYNSDLLTLAAKHAVEQGIVVVAAAGNEGKDSQGRRQYGGITSPGNAPWVLTVGASSHMGTVDRNDDTVAWFSSRGPTAIDRAAKPDLLAPGVGIESLSDPHSRLFQTKSAYLLAGSVFTTYQPYLSLTGTSQAAPVVTGTVALMLQANPALTPNAVKAILQYTADAYPGYDPLTQGAGFLNARGAVDLARFLASPQTVPYPAPSGSSGQFMWGNRRVRGGYFTPNANAWRNDTVWGATTTADGRAVAWGVVCSAATCDANSGWTSWDTSCSDAGCGTPMDTGTPINVVWGFACNGENCSNQTWSVYDTTVVWGTGEDGETVVWGTSGDETVVWGTVDGETVVWGTSGDEDVLWDRCGS